MSYVNKLEYMIVVTDTFNILRGCAGCGSKRIFVCSGNFRVNANGNRLDVWLIYRCEACGHTYNLSIYERVKSGKIPKAEYKKFLENDEDTVFRYGTDKSVFARNRAEVDWNSVKYKIISLDENKPQDGEIPMLITIHNPQGMPVRKDKVTAGILQISRSKVTEMIDTGQLFVDIKK